jgi:hypothetical protein
MYFGLSVGMGGTEAVLFAAYFLGLYREEQKFIVSQAVIIPLFVATAIASYLITKRFEKRKSDRSSQGNTEMPTRGWLPKEPSISLSQVKTGGKGRVAHVVGYGVGIGVCELLMLSIYLLGWGNVERSLSPEMNILSSIFVSLIGTYVGLIIGSLLSKKLLKRWRIKP